MSEAWVFSHSSENNEVTKEMYGEKFYYSGVAGFEIVFIEEAIPKGVN